MVQRIHLWALRRGAVNTLLGTYSVSVREGILCMVAWLASFYPHNNPVKLTLLFSPPYKWGNPGEDKQSNLLKVSLIVRVNRDYSVIGCLPDSRGRAPPSTIACPWLGRCGRPLAALFCQGSWACWGRDSGLAPVLRCLFWSRQVEASCKHIQSPRGREELSL